jgi:nitroreductase
LSESSYPLIDHSGVAVTESTEDLSFFDIVGNVRAMRRLKPDPVPMNVMWKVLNAGVQAPSGQNTQPWKFVLVGAADRKKWFADRYAAAFESRFGLKTNPAERGEYRTNGQLGALYHQMDHLHEAPYLLLVCGERDWPFKVAQEDRVGLAPPNYGAVYPCVQNILLACRSLGLGAALTTMHQVFEEELHEYFGIPHDFGVVVTIPIGYPIGRFGPVTRTPAADKTYIDRWGAS